MSAQEALIKASTLLTNWVVLIGIQNAIHFTDINRIAENVVQTLLNLVYNFQLIRLEYIQKDYPGIDLGDSTNEIGVQVTTDNSTEKILDSLTKYMALPEQRFHKRIIFFFPGKDKPKFYAKTITNFRTLCPFFDPNKDILTEKDILIQMERIYNEDKKKFQEILAYLEQEFGPGNVRDNRAMLRKKSREFYDNLRGPNGRFKHLHISELILPSTKTEWLPTRATVNTSANTQTEVVSEVLVSLWQEKIRHAVVLGEGGMGKTVNLVLWWQKLLEQMDINGPIPLYLALNELNQVPPEERHDFILSYLIKNYGDANLTLKQLQNTLSHASASSQTTMFILLLDGFNEITVEKQQLLVEIKWLREMCPGIQLVLTSRYDMREVCQWLDWNLITLMPLAEEQIDACLSNGTVLQPALKTLLGNPMMLTLYAATCEVQREFGDSTLYRFKPQVESPAELLWNFMEAQVAKLPERLRHDEKEISYYAFLLRFLLPALGFEMEKLGLFDFTREQMREVLERVCQSFASTEFFAVFPEFLKHRKSLPVGACVEPLDSMERADHLKEIICTTLCMMVKEGSSFRFLHQNFRDFFAAVAVWNQMEMGWHKKEIPEVLKERCLDFFVRRMVGELAGEFRLVPRCVPGEGWSYPIEPRTRLSDILELCRGEFRETDREKVGYAVWNILTIWKELRGELSGLDLSELDLTGFTFNAVRCSRYNNGEYLAARFNSSRLHEKNLLPQGHSGEVASAVYSSDGKKILSASSDHTIKEWDVATGACVSTFTGHSHWVNSAVYSSDGKKILSASDDHTIKEWDVATGACVSTLTRHSRGVTSAVYSQDGKKILSASEDKTIKEWDVASGACVSTLTLNSDRVTSAVYSWDGKKILSASYDNAIKEWDVATGACVSTLIGHSSIVTSVVYSRDGKKILSASYDHTIKEWDVATGACMSTLTGHYNSGITNAVYSRDGKKILSASEDKTIKEWDVATDACVSTLTGHSNKVTSSVYSTNGKKILSASYDETIKEWDVSTGTCVSILIGHSHWVNSAVYSRDGKKILSASFDETIKEWDVVTGVCLKTHNKFDKTTFPDYTPLYSKNELKTEYNSIYLPDPTNEEEEKKLINIPGLWMQGCSFENLEAGSQWTEEGKEILRMYGGETGS